MLFARKIATKWPISCICRATSGMSAIQDIILRFKPGCDISKSLLGYQHEPNFHQALWNLIDLNKNALVGEFVEHVVTCEIMDKDKCVHAGMYASATIGKPLKVLRLSKTVNSSPELSWLSSNLILRSFYNSERIEQGEAYLCHWLKNYVGGSNLAVTMALSNQLTNHGQTFHHTKSSSEKNQLEIFQSAIDKLSEVTSLPDLKTWRSMVQQYSTRGAWLHCLFLLNFLEEIMSSSGVVIARDCHIEDSTVLPVPVPVGRDDLAAVYVMTIKALCAGNRLDLVQQLLQHTKDQNWLNSRTHTDLLSHVIGAVAAVEPRHSALLTGQRQALLAIAHKMTSLCKSPATAPSSTQDSVVMIDAATCLVEALCSRGLVKDADMFLKELDDCDRMSAFRLLDGTTLNVLIKHLCTKNDTQRALELFGHPYLLDKPQLGCYDKSSSYHCICQALAAGGEQNDNLTFLMHQMIATNN